MIVQAVSNTFKRELLEGVHDFTLDTFKLALFKATASIVGTYNASTDNYSDMTADEVTGTGYTAGGVTLTKVPPVISGDTALVDFADAVITGATFTTRGAMIYNASQGNKTVAIWDFGTDKVVNAGVFTVQMPTPSAALALLRLS